MSVIIEFMHSYLQPTYSDYYKGPSYLSTLIKKKKKRPNSITQSKITTKIYI